MGEQDSRDVTAYCSAEGAAVTVPSDADDVVQAFKEGLATRLRKKGVNLIWSDKAEGAALTIRIVQVDRGNQFLRWFLPFLAPAVVEAEAQIAIPGAPDRPFHDVQKAHFAIFGGSAKYMLKVCAGRLAGNLAGTILRAVSA